MKGEPFNRKGLNSMCVRINRNGSAQIIRLETDMVMESDVDTVQETVEQSLEDGIQEFVLSVSIGTLTNRRIISRLIEWCRDTIWRQRGKLLFVEKNDGGECIFGPLCESLRIPMSQNIDTTLVETSETVHV
jgi:hypothetical protein